MEAHGECKTLGGKLVAVDLILDGSVITQARIHGDFFVHPEASAATLLAALGECLLKLPMTTELAALEARLQAAIPVPVELLGTTPRAIATAVRRAIVGEDARSEVMPVARIGAFDEDDLAVHAARWSRLPWRLLPEVSLSPTVNTALDEVLTQRLIENRMPPTLRFWRWSEPAVIVGRCQAVSNEVDRAAAEAMGVQVVRRMTVGGAMLLQPHGAITYSLYLPEAAVVGLTLRQSYEVCDAWVVRGLRRLGVDAHHVPINDIACGAGKIGGAAQARRAGVVLHHTTLAYDMDPGEMLRVLRIGREKLKDKAVASAAKRVSPLVQQTGRSREAIVDHLFRSFQSEFGGTLSQLTPDELADAEALAQSKYATPEWTLQFE